MTTYITKKKLTLKEWMEQNKVDQYTLAEKIGCHHQSVENWRDKIHKPHRLNKREILRATNYEVEL